MAKRTADSLVAPAGPTTLADLLREAKPMGDLRSLIVADLSPEDEEEFFRILSTL